MIIIKTEKYFQIVLFVLMLTAFLPVVFNRLPAYIGSHHLWAIVWGISLLFLKPKVFVQKLMLLVSIYALFLWFMFEFTWENMDKWNAIFLWDELYAIAVGCSVITYFHVSKDYKGLAKLIKYTFLFFIITAVLTLIASIIDPMFFRIMFQISTEGIKANYLSNKLGAAGYGYILGYTALLPLLIYLFKNNYLIEGRKTILLFIIILFLFVIVRVQLFTNIMFSIAFLWLALVSVENRTRTLVILSMFFIVLAFIPNSVYVNILNYLSDSFSNLNELSFKLKEFSVYVETGGEVSEQNAVAGRADRYPMLFEVFPKKPIFGCYFFSDITGNGYKVEAAHLYWMNKLTVSGLSGFLLFFLIIIFFLKNEIKNINKGYRYYFILSCLVVLLYGLFKNIIGRETWYVFFVIIPGICYLPLLNKNKENKIIKDE